MRLLFLGPPGAGKGTQARELAREWGVPQVATGDMLREAMAAGTPLGRAAKQYYDRGELVPDDVILKMVAERFGQPDAAQGFILDGFPRTIAQADGLGAMLEALGHKLDGVIYFDVSEPELIRRLTGRRLCRQCQTPFHVVSAPPKFSVPVWGIPRAVSSGYSPSGTCQRISPLLRSMALSRPQGGLIAG